MNSYNRQFFVIGRIVKRRHYKWYSAFYRLNERIERKFTMSGQVLVLCAFALVFFGLNTRISMLFVVFAASIALLLTDAVSLMFKSFGFEFERFLPECASKGKEVKYPVILRAESGKESLENLFYSEVPASPMPDFEVFNSTKEPGEEKRNAFDKRMGYYRWKWLVSKNCGGNTGSLQSPAERPSAGSFSMHLFRPKDAEKSLSGAHTFFTKGFSVF